MRGSGSTFLGFLSDGLISNGDFAKRLVHMGGPGLRASQASELYESQLGVNCCKPCRSRSCLRGKIFEWFPVFFE